MHCKSCELLIEDKLSQVSGIKKAKADFKKGLAEIYYESRKPDDSALSEAVRESGYEIGRDDEQTTYLFSSNLNDYKDLGIAFLFLAVIYFALKIFGVTGLNFAPSTSNPENLSVVLLIGLTAGFSTCMALVGGLILGVSTKHAEKHPEATPAQKFRPHLFFNLGRILSYFVLGSVLGAVGSVFQISSFALGILTIFVGVIMLLMGLQLIDIFPVLNKIKMTLPKSVSRFLGISRHEKEYSHKGAMILGGLTFFLPCGFTQSMQLLAISTGNPFYGALIMGTFALGTAPGLLGIGGITSVVKGIFAKRFFKFAGLLVIFFSLFNISNGYNLTGIQLGNSNIPKPSKSALVNAAPIENGVQVIRMAEKSNGYSPNKFTVRAGIPVKWIIDGQDPYSCASSFVVNKLGISKKINKGENVIEFTPKEAGQIKFSCSMGMYTGVINVVNEDGTGDVSVSDNNDQPARGGCAMMGGNSGQGGCGGVRSDRPSVSNEKATESVILSDEKQQTIKTVYTSENDIVPSVFNVKAGMPVKFEIDVKDEGYGCMSTIMIPGLYNNPEYLQAGEKIVMEFTPNKKGEYRITCAMGVPRGILKVN